MNVKASAFASLRMSGTPTLDAFRLSPEMMSALGQSATSAGESPMSERSPKADIELSRVSVAENTGAVFLNGPSLLWNDGLPAP